MVKKYAITTFENVIIFIFLSDDSSNQSYYMWNIASKYTHTTNVQTKSKKNNILFCSNKNTILDIRDSFENNSKNGSNFMYDILCLLCNMRNNGS